jgi:hypothetical protein
MTNKRLPRWLGILLAPAEDPRRGVAAFAPPAAPEALLAELRRSRAELSQLRSRIELDNPVARELAEEEQSLLEVERSLLQSLDERRAQAALLEARRRTAEAEVWTEL